MGVKRFKLQLLGFSYTTASLLNPLMGWAAPPIASSIASQDTVFHLNEVTVSTQRNTESTQLGTRITALNLSAIESTITQSLSELLSENSLIYIKSMGQGSLATSSFRGTSSNHTRVNWNGISINSPMLGNFDFSMIPSFFTDEVTLYHGNSYQKNGAGALGGSINLDNTPLYNRNLETKLLAEVGANSTYTGAASIGRGSDRFAFRSRIYYQQSKNDFRYLNKVLSKDPFYERRSNADYRNAGVMQEFYFRPDHRNHLSANIWLMGGKRSLPQPIMVNAKTIEKQQTYNVRTLVGWNTDVRGVKINTSMAYIRDFMEYTRGWETSRETTQQDNLSNTLALRAEAEKQWKRYTLTTNLNYRIDRVDSDGYTGGGATRNTAIVHFNNRFDFNRLSLNGAVAVEANDRLVMPTFTTGASTSLIPQLLDAKASVGYNYRYPSLNDLYWTPGGNANLTPEKGFAEDITLSFTPQTGIFRWKVDATYYHALITDWITWLPTDKYYWEPKNIRKVRSHGLELMSDVSFKTHAAYHKLTFNYGFSPSLNLSDDSKNGKQLPYVPRNKWNGRYRLNVAGFGFSYNLCYTSQRFTTTDESYSTNAYLIHDVEATYRFPISATQCTAKVRVDNLLDTYYESTQYYPMPLRALYLSFAVTM